MLLLTLLSTRLGIKHAHSYARSASLSLSPSPHISHAVDFSHPSCPNVTRREEQEKAKEDVSLRGFDFPLSLIPSAPPTTTSTKCPSNFRSFLFPTEKELRNKGESGPGKHQWYVLKCTTIQMRLHPHEHQRRVDWKNYSFAFSLHYRICTRTLYSGYRGSPPPLAPPLKSLFFAVDTRYLRGLPMQSIRWGEPDSIRIMLSLPSHTTKTVIGRERGEERMLLGTWMGKCQCVEPKTKDIVREREGGAEATSKTGGFGPISMAAYWGMDLFGNLNTNLPLYVLKCSSAIHWGGGDFPLN